MNRRSARLTSAAPPLRSPPSRSSTGSSSFPVWCSLSCPAAFPHLLSPPAVFPVRAAPPVAATCAAASFGCMGARSWASAIIGRKLRMVEVGASPCKICCRIGGMHREARYLRRWREVDPWRRLDLRRRWDSKSWRRAVLRRPPTSLQAWISLPRWSWLMRGLQMSSRYKLMCPTETHGLFAHLVRYI